MNSLKNAMITQIEYCKRLSEPEFLLVTLRESLGSRLLLRVDWSKANMQERGEKELWIQSITVLRNGTIRSTDILMIMDLTSLQNHWPFERFIHLLRTASKSISPQYHSIFVPCVWKVLEMAMKGPLHNEDLHAFKETRERLAWIDELAEKIKAQWQEQERLRSEAKAQIEGRLHEAKTEVEERRREVREAEERLRRANKRHHHLQVLQDAEADADGDYYPLILLYVIVVAVVMMVI